MNTDKKSLVVTTIASPNECLAALAAGAKHHNYQFICIGDKKSPAEFALDGCDFYSAEAQQQLDFSLVNELPWNHYCRKNLGYLQGMASGAQQILETDDDNFPQTDDFWQIGPSTQVETQIVGNGWLNIYAHFGVDAWPRGFPLEKIQVPDDFDQQTCQGESYIKQSLVNGDPDVDAVFRLTRGLDITFARYEPVALGAGVWCPFNSQNTLWQRPAFPLLYLPVTCSFRATDIVRSYVAQRCLWEMAGHVVFSGANTKQVRNEHDLLKDFNDEIVIYLKAEAIRLALSNLKLEPGLQASTILDNLTQCYRKLVELQVVEEQELSLLAAWVKDINPLL